MMRRRLASVGIDAPASGVGGDTVARGKPDPEGYLRGAALLTRPPHECLGVMCQEVVYIEPCSADGWRQTEASMGSVPVVLVDPGLELLVALF